MDSRPREQTDSVLAKGVGAGDVSAFEMLVARYSDRLFRLAWAILGDRADAEDVVQDVLLTVWRRGNEISDPAAVRTWMFQVARRHCLMLLRDRRKQCTDPVAKIPEHRSAVGAAMLAGRDPQRVAEVWEGVDALGQALTRLPVRQRDVWLLAEVDGLSYLEIARRVGAGEQAVRGRLSRARATLAGVMRAWR